MFVYDDLSSISVAELKTAQNWQSQYRLITQWGTLIRRKEAIRLDENLLRGCETSAWLAHEVCGEIHRFAFDSDSRVINGLVALLLSQVDKRTSTEITALNLEQTMSEMGLEKHLTPSRNNGLRAIIARLKKIAETI